MASMKATAVRRSTKSLMREALLVFELEGRAMPGTLHQLPAHIKRAPAAARLCFRASAGDAQLRATGPRSARSAFRRLHPEHDEDDHADSGELQQLPPAASASVMQSAHADREL